MLSTFESVAWGTKHEDYAHVHIPWHGSIVWWGIWKVETVHMYTYVGSSLAAWYQSIARGKRLGLDGWIARCLTLIALCAVLKQDVNHGKENYVFCAMNRPGTLSCSQWWVKHQAFCKLSKLTDLITTLLQLNQPSYNRRYLIVSETRRRTYIYLGSISSDNNRARITENNTDWRAAASRLLFCVSNNTALAPPTFARNRCGRRVRHVLNWKYPYCTAAYLCSHKCSHISEMEVDLQISTQSAYQLLTSDPIMVLSLAILLI